MHATNVLAVDLERENARLRERVKMLEQHIDALRPRSVFVGEYRIDALSGWIWRDGHEVGHLTRTEARLLACLAVTPGTPISYDTIAAMVWPGMTGEDVQHVTHHNLVKIRKKLCDTDLTWTREASSSRFFRTVRGYGVVLLT